MHWTEIPGWFQWRTGQEEAIAYFAEGSRFVEVGVYLGRSLCSLAEVVASSNKNVAIIGVDTCRGSGPEGPHGKDYHVAAAEEGGGTFAGSLHRNVLGCDRNRSVSLVIADSVLASSLFADASLDWVHLDARHDHDSVVADIGAWLPKIKTGGWLSGDDYDPVKWPGVVSAVRDTLPDARPWSCDQWRLILA